MRSRGLAFLIVAGLLGALYAVLSLQGGAGSRSHEPARPATSCAVRCGPCGVRSPHGRAMRRLTRLGSATHHGDQP